MKKFKKTNGAANATVSAPQRKDVYQMVTDKIIAELESGRIPWVKSWTGGIGAINYVSREQYKGINTILLPYEGEYLSFKQVQDLKGQVKKGEKAHMIVFWKMYDYETTNQEGELESKRRPMLRYYNVFHLSQTTGIPSKATKVIPQNDNDIILNAQAISDNYLSRENLKLNLISGSDRCYYSPLSDFISMPVLSQFNSSEEFYSTLFHEMIHSTGHKKRLNRFEDERAAAFGDHNYSKEELTAEIGAAFLNSTAGILSEKLFKNNIAYIQGWLKALKSNSNKFIVEAACKAKKAVFYITSDKDNPNNEPEII